MILESLIMIAIALDVGKLNVVTGASFNSKTIEHKNNKQENETKVEITQEKEVNLSAANFSSTRITAKKRNEKEKNEAKEDIFPFNGNIGIQLERDITRSVFIGIEDRFHFKKSREINKETELRCNPMSFIGGYVGYKISPRISAALAVNYVNQGMTMHFGKQFDTLRLHGVQIEGRVNFNITPLIDLYESIGGIIGLSDEDYTWKNKNGFKELRLKSNAPYASLGIVWKLKHHDPFRN